MKRKTTRPVKPEPGQNRLSRTGILHLAEEIIAGRTVGNVQAAVAMKEKVLRDYPEK